MSDIVFIPLLPVDALEKLRDGFENVGIAPDEYRAILAMLNASIKAFENREVVAIAMMPLTQQSVDMLKQSGKTHVYYLSDAPDTTAT